MNLFETKEDAVKWVRENLPYMVKNHDNTKYINPYISQNATELIIQKLAYKLYLYDFKTSDSDKKITVEEIKQKVSKEFPELENALINFKNRQLEFVLARQVFIFVLKIKLKFSLHKIASITLKDHSTVIHSIKTIKNLMVYDKKLSKKIENILK